MCVMVQRFHPPIFSWAETKPRPQKLDNIVDRLTPALLIISWQLKSGTKVTIITTVFLYAGGSVAVDSC